MDPQSCAVTWPRATPAHCCPGDAHSSSVSCHLELLQHTRERSPCLPAVSEGKGHREGGPRVLGNPLPLFCLSSLVAEGKHESVHRPTGVSALGACVSLWTHTCLRCTCSQSS